MLIKNKMFKIVKTAKTRHFGKKHGKTRHIGKITAFDENRSFRDFLLSLTMIIG